MKKQFMVILRGQQGNWEKFSKEKQKELEERYYAWAGKLREQERLTGGSALTEHYRSLKAQSGQVHVDGPYAETKEILTGYFMIKADSLDEATEISKECPALTHGDWVQVYEMPPAKE